MANDVLRPVFDLLGLGQPQTQSQQTSGTQTTSVGQFNPAIQSLLNRELTRLLNQPTPAAINQQDLEADLRSVANRFIADQTGSLIRSAGARGALDNSQIQRLNERITSDVATNLVRELPTLYAQTLQNQQQAALNPIQQLSGLLQLAEGISPRTQTVRTEGNTESQSSVDPIGQLLQLGGVGVAGIDAFRNPSRSQNRSIPQSSTGGIPTL